MQHLLSTTYSHTSQTADEACNFNCLIKTEGLLQVTGSHVHRKSGRPNISEMVQAGDAVTTDLIEHIAHQIAPFPTPRVNFKSIHRLHVFPNAIFRTVVQQLTRLQLTQGVARSLCDS